MFTHQEVVARSKTLEADSFETEPGDVFLTNVDTPDSYIQKQGHGALVSTRKANGITPRSAPGRGIARGIHLRPARLVNLGRETAIQKVYWDDEGWPRIEGGHGGKTFVEGPKDAIFTESASDNSQQDDFTSPALDPNWNTLRVPFTAKMGTTGDGKLTFNRPWFVSQYA